MLNNNGKSKITTSYYQIFVKECTDEKYDHTSHRFIITHTDQWYVQVSHAPSMHR